MDKKEEYRERLEAQLKEWKAKIDRLEERTSTVSSEAKAELMQDIEELRRKKVVVKEKWSELQKASGDAWDTTKEGVEKAAAELKHAFDKVVSRFK
jgi:DNA repair exonuclease SbcCD ATPase subunit